MRSTLFQLLKRKGILPFLYLCVALFVTFCITFFFAVTLKELVQTQYERQYTSVTRILNTRVQTYSFLLKGIQSIMESDPTFTEEAFINYLQRFVNPSIYPGLIETGYIGKTLYHLSYQPNVPQDLLFNNQAALVKARDTGTFSTTVYKNKILLIFLPVYNTESPAFVHDRQNTITGYAYVAINIDDMLKEIVAMQNEIGFTLNKEPYYSTTTSSNDLSILEIKKDSVYRFFDVDWPITLTLYPSKELLDHLLFLVIIFIFGVSCGAFIFKISYKQYWSQKKADNLERQKDEFVAIASHELKTPLTSIKALNQLLAEKLLTEHNPLYESYFRKTDSQIKRMEILINDLLDVSKIRAGKLTYNKNWFDLETVVRSVCDERQELKKSHQITINGHVTHQVYGDKDRISQVIINLLTNAAKYSPQANLIIVRMKETLNEVIVSIKDFGIGIVSENQKKIFERFYRVTTDERKYKGMGIGLFISSEIIQKHGGKIWVKSTKGKGSTFSFSLPLKPIEE